MDADAYLSQLLQLLPGGPGLPREPGSPLTRLLGVPAAELARVDARAARLLVEAIPNTTEELLVEWERAFGLPDECSAPFTLIEQRRAALLARITEQLSPSIPNIESVAAAYGVRASVVEYRDHTCELSCEAPVTDTPWVHAFTVWGGGRVVTEATCEDTGEQPLRLWSDLPHECAIRRLAPAHTVPLFGSFQDEWNFLGGLPAGATYARASALDRVNERGLLELLAPNVPPMMYRTGLTYNVSLNPWGDGAIYPTEWSPVGGGLTAAMTARWDNEDGTRTVEITVTGVSTGNPQMVSFTEAFGLPVSNECSPGAVFALDVGIEVIESIGCSIAAWIYSLSGTGGIINTNSLSTGQIAAGSGFARRRRAGGLNNLATAGAGAGVRVENVTNGQAVNAVFRVTGPVLNAGGSYLTDTVPLASIAQRIGAVPQYGLLGLMIAPEPGNELRLAVPDGIYSAQITSANPAGVVGTYAQSQAVAIAGSLRFEWPAAAVLAGATNLRSLILRKVT